MPAPFEFVERLLEISHNFESCAVKSFGLIQEVAVFGVLIAWSNIVLVLASWKKVLTLSLPFPSFHLILEIAQLFTCSSSSLDFGIRERVASKTEDSISSAN